MMQRPFSPPGVKQTVFQAINSVGGQGYGAGDRPAGTLSGVLEQSFIRLEEILDQETVALNGRGAVDLKSFNDRKSQALLELSRLVKHVKPSGENDAIRGRIASLQSKLAINQRVLQLHLEAVREISTTISDAIREADSDGTYSPSIYVSGRRQ